MTDRPEKVRRIDFTPDEFIAGIAGIMTDREVGIYWVVCALMYSTGGAVPYEATVEKIAGLLKAGRRPVVERAIARLVQIGKLQRDGDLLINKRSQDEIDRVSSRIRKAQENGAKGGRPRSGEKRKAVEGPHEEDRKTIEGGKEEDRKASERDRVDSRNWGSVSGNINDLAKPTGFSGEKLTPTPTPTPTPTAAAANAAAGPIGAARVIELFDEVRVRVFGPEQARPWPHTRDKAYAEQILATGADLETIAFAFERAFKGQLARNERPAGHLGYMVGPVQDAVRQGSASPKTRGRDAPEGPSMPSAEPEWAIMSKHCMRQRDRLGVEIAKAAREQNNAELERLMVVARQRYPKVA